MRCFRHGRSRPQHSLKNGSACSARRKRELSPSDWLCADLSGREAGARSSGHVQLEIKRQASCVLPGLVYANTKWAT